MSTYRSWNVSSVSFQQRASRRFCNYWDTFFASLTDVYGGYLLSRYGCICWVITEDLFSIYLLIRIHKHNWKKTPQFLWVCGKRYSTFISEKNYVSGQKDKYNPWYLKYKVLNEIGYFVQNHSTKQKNQIVQFSSRTFGRLPHFIKAIFSVYSLILLSCSVIYFITRILGYKLELARIPKYPYHRPRCRYPGNNYLRGYR